MVQRSEQLGRKMDFERLKRMKKSTEPSKEDKKASSAKKPAASSKVCLYLIIYGSHFCLILIVIGLIGEENNWESEESR
jgi:hypothetical protein